PTTTSTPASTSPAPEVAWPEIVAPGAAHAAPTPVVDPPNSPVVRVAPAPDAPTGPSVDVHAAETSTPGTSTPETPVPPSAPTHSDVDPVGTDPSEPRRAGRPGAETEVLRRRWPEVLETLKQIKRVSWILVSQNAQVADLDATTLRLSFTGAGVATAFRNGPHAAAIQQAVRETLGFDVRVEGVLDEHTGASDGAGRPRSSGTSAPDDQPAHGPDGAATAAPASVSTGPRPGSAGSQQPGAVVPVDAPVPERHAPGPHRAEPAPQPAEPARHRGATAPGTRPPGASPSRDGVAGTGAADEIPDAEDPGDPEWRGLDPDDGPPIVSPPTRPAAVAPASTARPATTSRPSPRVVSQSEPRPASQPSARPAGQPSQRPASGRPMSAREAGELAYARAEAARRAAAAVEDSPSPDDPDLATSGLTGAPLVAQMLGGTVIDEQLGDEA
ncbi:MAG: DNA polymerase III subunit gamma/tau domain-containing protein, partial [Cellulomonas sp.]